MVKQKQCTKHAFFTTALDDYRAFDQNLAVRFFSLLLKQLNRSNDKGVAISLQNIGPRIPLNPLYCYASDVMTRDLVLHSDTLINT